MRSTTIEGAQDHISEEAVRDSATNLASPGSILAVVRSGILARTAPIAVTSVQVAFNQDIKSIEPDPAKADVWFLYWVLKAYEPVILSDGVKKGATVHSIRSGFLESLEIPLPLLDEQRRIANVVGVQMAAVEMARAAAEAQLEAAKAFSVEWVRSVFQQREVGGSQSVSLRELSNAPSAFSDGPFGSNLKTAHYTTTGARVVRLQNIGRGEFLDADKAYVSLEHFAHLERHHVQSGDVVVAALGDGARPAGRACIVPNDFGPGLVKADCFRVRLPQDVILPEYLVAYLNSPESLRRVSELMRGATRPRVNLEMLRQLVVPVPSLAVQRELLAALHGRSARALMMQAAGDHQLRAIAALPAALLRRAFSGEL